ncbi:MAG TPA: hypothetical protein VI821_00625 [Candidatus Paceibacterota bacterium]
MTENHDNELSIVPQFAFNSHILNGNSVLFITSTTGDSRYDYVKLNDLLAATGIKNINLNTVKYAKLRAALADRLKMSPTGLVIDVIDAPNPLFDGQYIHFTLATHIIAEKDPNLMAAIYSIYYRYSSGDLTLSQEVAQIRDRMQQTLTYICAITANRNSSDTTIELMNQLMLDNYQIFSVVKNNEEKCNELIKQVTDVTRKMRELNAEKNQYIKYRDNYSALEYDITSRDLDVDTYKSIVKQMEIKIERLENTISKYQNKLDGSDLERYEYLLNKHCRKVYLMQVASPDDNVIDILTETEVGYYKLSAQRGENCVAILYYDKEAQLAELKTSLAIHTNGERKRERVYNTSVENIRNALYEILHATHVLVKTESVDLIKINEPETRDKYDYTAGIGSAAMSIIPWYDLLEQRFYPEPEKRWMNHVTPSPLEFIVCYARQQINLAIESIQLLPNTDKKQRIAYFVEKVIAHIDELAGIGEQIKIAINFLEPIEIVRYLLLDKKSNKYDPQTDWTIAATILNETDMNKVLKILGIQTSQPVSNFGVISINAKEFADQTI